MLIDLLLLSLLSSAPQQPAPDPRQAAAAQANAQSEQVRHAEDLLERGDYAGAEPLLANLAKADPKDAHILFDLGFTQERNGHEAVAEKSYEAAIDADPTFAEPRIALGLLQVRSGQTDRGGRSLNDAAALPSISPDLKARALRALARLDQPANPDKARDELAQAIQLTGQKPGDAELTASLTASNASPGDAEATFRAALAKDPNDLAAMVELASLLQKQNKLAEADALLTPALTAHPGDPTLTAQTATLYAAEDKTPEALNLLKALRASNPQAAENPSLTRLYAHLLLVSGNAASAEPLYRSLAQSQPDDPTLLDDLGSTLVREQEFPEAQAVLTEAVSQRQAFHDDAAWGETAGHLAFAASRNHQPQVALQALHARATVLPNSAATLFLEATSHDALHEKKEAERAYRAFLAAANGKLPDEEFEARHRLIALEHER
jgi:tetratricopeptide (TPR) repeat protein